MNVNITNVLQIFQASAVKPTATDSRSSPGRPSSTTAPQLGYLKGQAIVEQAISPDHPGRVRFKGSRWFARCDHSMTILPGELVDVIGVQKITLLVEPAFLLTASKIGLARLQNALMHHDRLFPPGEPVERSEAKLAARLAQVYANLPEPIALDVWQRFVSGKPVYFKTFKACCQALGLEWQSVVGYGDIDASLEPADEAEAQQLRNPDDDLNFVGRAEAIVDLKNLVEAGTQIITILGEGGIGKTILAQQYFEQENYDLVLECWMAKETQNLTAAEGVLLSWLKQHFQEEPARTFGAALEQLKRHLQDSESRRVGVLFDNLEPAIDRNGRFLEAHRGYAALLETLADPLLNCVVLVTSREPLHEETISLQPYVLSGLDEKAWRQFFSYRQIATDSPAFTELHRAYSGNAKAMRILSSAIQLDYAGNVATFWQEHQADLLDEPGLGELVSSQFRRLQQVYPEAYRLLCRMGCYRFQDVATVPAEALSCLLWDVPPAQHRSITRFLRDLFLVEVEGEAYRLHPVIQAKAVSILRANSAEWERTNREAADFWTERVTTIDTVEDAMMAAEAYRHYVQLQDWDSAAAALLYGRDSQWEKNEPLGISFYRLGLLQRMISAVRRVINHLTPGYPLCKLYNILGDLLWLIGDLQEAIVSHQKSREMAIELELKGLEIQALFNIGLCHIGLWELETAAQFFDAASIQATHTEWHMYAVGCWFCLAYLNSCRGQVEEAQRLAQRVSNEYATLSSSAWSRGYSLLFLGQTLLNLGDLDKAQQMYELAHDYAEQSRYTQVKAEALNGLAVLCRKRQDFQGAIANHQTAKQMLERLEAKGDLAEVYYQLGLTYQQMNELTESRHSFEAASELFQKMDAPQQVQRVQQALKTLNL
ncbi:tetratricopeptide repeat protein [Phormidium tenue FACHB-886]|nr:tetratricopeptide repeat protein [Phormidium tenue FACHB-886]